MSSREWGSRTTNPDAVIKHGTFPGLVKRRVLHLFCFPPFCQFSTLWEMVLRRHRWCRWCTRRMAVVVTIIFLVILLCKKTHYTFTNQLGESDSDTVLSPAPDVTTIEAERLTNSASIYSSTFNPFVENKKKMSVNDIMTAYSQNDFSDTKTRNRSVKRILFWNEAYGSKDYGNKLNCAKHQMINF